MSCQPAASPDDYIVSHKAPALFATITNTLAYRVYFARFKSQYGKKVAPAGNIAIAPKPIFPPGLCPPHYLSIPNAGPSTSINDAFKYKVRSVRSMMKSPPTSSPSPEAMITPIGDPGVCVSTSTYQGISTKNHITTCSLAASAPPNACVTRPAKVSNMALDCIIIPANPCPLPNARKPFTFSKKSKPVPKKPGSQSILIVAAITQDTESTMKVKVVEKSNEVVVNETLLQVNPGKAPTQPCREFLPTDIMTTVQEGYPLSNAYRHQQGGPTANQVNAAIQMSMTVEYSKNINDPVKEPLATPNDGFAIELIATQGDAIDAETTILKPMDPIETIIKECTAAEKIIAEDSLETNRAVDSGNSFLETKTTDQSPTENTTKTKQDTVLKYEPITSGNISVQGEHALVEVTSSGPNSIIEILMEEDVSPKNEPDPEDNTILTNTLATTGDTTTPYFSSTPTSYIISSDQSIIEPQVIQNIFTHEDTAIQSKLVTDTNTSAGSEATSNKITEIQMVHINQYPSEAYPFLKNTITKLDTAFDNHFSTNDHANTTAESTIDAFSILRCKEPLTLERVSVDTNSLSERLALKNEKVTTEGCSIKENGHLSTKMAETMNPSINTHSKTTFTTAVPKGLACASDFKDWLAKMKSPKSPNVRVKAASDAVIPHSQQAAQFSNETIFATEPVIGFEAASEMMVAYSMTSPRPLDQAYIPIRNVEHGEVSLEKPRQRMTFDTAGIQDPQAHPLCMMSNPTSSQLHGFSDNRPHTRSTYDTTVTEVVTPPKVTAIPRSQSVSPNSSIGSGPKRKTLATARDFEAYMQATNVSAAKNVVSGSGVFLNTKEARIELPEKYLQCMAANCQYLTSRKKCYGSHHKRCPGATPLILLICPSFVKFGICPTNGTSCVRGVHPCPTKSRFNTCNNGNCPYLHDITIDQYGQALLTKKEPSILPTVNNLMSLSSITSVERRFDLEPPGTCTELGPRNDNDWRDYTKISILPTIDEIIPGRSTVYMPHKKMMFPLHKVLDVGFRHQREAMLGPVRDSVADVIRQITRGDYSETSAAEGSESKYKVYPRAKFCQAFVEGGRHAVATFLISFPSPGQAFLKIDKVLRKGHLLAILIRSENGFSVIWAKAMENWSDRDENGKFSETGHISVALIDGKTSEGDLGTILQLQSTQNEFCLVDFAGVLPDAFMNGLSVLQQMGGETLPFAHGLFEHQIKKSMFNIPPYLRDRMIDLSSLGYHEIYNHMGTLRADKCWSTLMKDKLTQENSKGMSFTGGQADAIINTLSLALSCIQGPPGTGKSFIGSAIVKLLAVNRRSWNDKQTIPILLTAQTNHALDETIAAYIRCGLKVARLGIAHGNESPEPEHVQYQHHILPRGQQDIHRKACNSAYKNREVAVHDLENLLEDVSKETLSWFRVSPYLQQNHIEFYQEFVKTSGDERAADGFNFWANNEDMDEESLLLTDLKKTIPEGLDIQTSPQEERDSCTNAQPFTQKNSTRPVNETDPWRLTAKQRKTLIDNWKSILNKSLDASVLAARATLQKCKDIYEKVLAVETAAKIVDFGIDVVACTATRAAKDHYLLKKLGIEVVVVEEAGEVVESVVLPIFLPSVQHVILIGDHEQLKPYCDNMTLIGGDYNHDKSLFERLVTPNTEGAPSMVRLARLDCQRRMRPEIADLVRCLGLYDKLYDGNNVQRYPHVPCMGGHNLLWVDHKQPESMSLDHSYCNSYEAAMVAGHAAHLFRSGEFGIRDLVIITPYRAQVKAINSALAKEGSLTIPVPATDLGLLSQRNLAYRRLLESAEEVIMVDVKVSDAVLVTTVDNYQGQEANVIFYSAVRSNQSGRVGFTDVSNRICVTLSRARHGMYIFGSADTAREGGKWWNKAVNHMQQLGLVVEGITLELCSRHPTQTRLVNDPSDFQPSSACDMNCGKTLACGHICNRRCHPEGMHLLPHFHCISSCDRLFRCGHKCGGICGAPCGDCLGCKNPAEQSYSDHRQIEPVVRKERLATEMCQHDLVMANCALCLEEYAVYYHNSWFSEFSRLYATRAQSLREAKENNVPSRQIFLRSLNLSRSGLRDNTYRFGVRMGIFSGFKAAFCGGLKQAEEIEEKFGYSGFVTRVEEVKARVNRAVEEDYSWLYMELLRLSTSRNSAELLAKALRKAVEEVLEVR